MLPDKLGESCDQACNFYEGFWNCKLRPRILTSASRQLAAAGMLSCCVMPRVITVFTHATLVAVRITNASRHMCYTRSKPSDMTLLHCLLSPDSTPCLNILQGTCSPAPFVPWPPSACRMPPFKTKATVFAALGQLHDANSRISIHSLCRLSTQAVRTLLHLLSPFPNHVPLSF